MQPSDMAALRAQLLQIDEDILALVARRMEVVSDIGRIKRRHQLPLRNFSRERTVIDHAVAAAERLHLPQSLARRFSELLIEHALAVQERGVVAETAAGEGRRALVIGGRGKIGNWFARFLATQGFSVVVADPLVEEESTTAVRDWRQLLLDVDMIVVAVPLDGCAAVLEELALRRPSSLIFDVASLKGPIRGAMDTLRRAGCRVASVHPMFGPDADMLAGRHVIFVHTGDDEALREARSLFADTMAVCVDMTLDEHDRLAAIVLGLSHLLNIAFFTALRNCGEDASRLQRISSTSFAAQLRVACRIAAENPHLYYEIQRLNEFRHAPREALTRALQDIIDIIEGGDEEAFVRIMEEGRAWLQTLPALAHQERDITP